MFLLRKKHFVFLVFLSLFGLVLTYAAHVAYKNVELEKLTSNLKERTEDRIFTFQELVEDNIDEMLSIEAFFNASEKVERQEFHRFCQTVLSHQPAVLALEWIPRILNAERKLYEESAQQDGLSKYQITERKKQGVMVPARERDEYFPVYYIEPLAGNELALGYDLGSDPVRLEALRLSMDTGKVVATSRITLVQETGEQSAFLIFLPIYNNKLQIDSVKARRKALIGFVLGVFRVGHLLEDSLSVLSPQGIDLYIYDESEKNTDKRFLAFHASRTRIEPYEYNPDEEKIAQDYYYSLDVRVADRIWKVYGVPTPEFILKFKTWQAWGVPGAIFLFFVFLVSYFVFLLDRIEKARLHAKELSRAKEVLEAEIHEREKTEHEKAHLEAQLRQAHKLESIGTLAGGIAHDFNNILTIIIGNTELVKLSKPADTKTQEQLGEVIKASRRAKDLVKQILSFSRKVEQNFQPVRPHLIVKDTINMLRSIIPATVDIQENIDTECGTIIVDPTQIHQILINLCTNAVHAMQEKGNLVISLKQTVLKEKDMAHRPDMLPGPYAELTVNDTGTGMDPEIIDRVFDPFFTTKDVGVGTGMGLSMVHGIVMSHRGMIKVDSEPGKGCVINVYLPVVESVEAIIHETQESLPTGTERILLVDDEKGINELGRAILEQQGYNVTTKTNSIEALGFFKSFPDEIDLVITDQSMPEMSGTELTAEIHKIRPGKPVVLCTGFSTKVSSKEEANALGIKEFIMKPYDQRSLVIIVRKILDEGQEG